MIVLYRRSLTRRSWLISSSWTSDSYTAGLKGYTLLRDSDVNRSQPTEPTVDFLSVQKLYLKTLWNRSWPFPSKSLHIHHSWWAGIAQSVQRRATGWMAGVRFPARERNFSRPEQVWGPPRLFLLVPGMKRSGREADHSPPSSEEVKNNGAIPPLPHVFMVWCLIN
jgi:hypothetical protein